MREGSLNPSAIHWVLEQCKTNSKRYQDCKVNNFYLGITFSSSIFFLKYSLNFFLPSPSHVPPTDQISAKINHGSISVSTKAMFSAGMVSPWQGKRFTVSQSGKLGYYQSIPWGTIYLTLQHYTYKITTATQYTTATKLPDQRAHRRIISLHPDSRRAFKWAQLRYCESFWRALNYL